MTTLTAAAAQDRLADLINGVVEKHKTYRIRHGGESALLISEAEYQGLKETLQLLSIPSFRDSILRSIQQMQNGETVDMDEALEE